jgi:hypothetical protein
MATCVQSTAFCVLFEMFTPPPQGVEMEDDFDGRMEDLQPDPDDAEGDGGEEEAGAEERLDQQMGDAGPDAQVGGLG